jgi:hypothetical protein
VKAFEEDWDAVGTSLRLAQEQWAKFEFNPAATPGEPNSYAHALERAKLAAQAPAMARLLEEAAKLILITSFRDDAEKVLRAAGVL